MSDPAVSDPAVSGPALIDLGLDRGEPEPAPKPAVRWRRQWSVRTRWLAAVATALLAFSLGGAAALTGRTLERVWSLPIAGGEGPPFGKFTTHDDRLYLLGPGRLTAYHLADGRVDWETELDITDEFASISAVADTLLVNGTDGGAEVVTAYDPGSGELSWRNQGSLWVRGDDWLLLHRAEPGGRTGLVSIEPDTGRVVGRAGGDAAVDVGIWHPLWRAPDGARHLFDLQRDGELVRYNLSTGAARHVQTPHVEREPDSWQNQLRLEDGLLTVTESGGERSGLLAGYDPATLTHVWTVPRGSYTTPCGEFVCVNVNELGAGTPYEYVRAVDPLTGASRWTLRCPDAGDNNEQCARISVHQLQSSSQVWVTEDWLTGEDTERYRSWIADAATGAPLTAPTDWSFQSQLDDGTLLLTRGEEGAAAPGEAAEPPRTWWGRSDADLDRIEVLGAVTADICLPHLPYLVCGTEGGSTAIWRFGG